MGFASLYPSYETRVARSPYSGLIPAALMIGNSRLSSASRNLLISDDEAGQGVAPRSA